MVYEKVDVEEDQNQYVRYASKISNNDLDFLGTLEHENGLWTHDRKHPTIGENGYYDYGFCGTNAGWHPNVYNDPRFYGDPYWQLDQCWRMYEGGTTFYGYQHRASHFHQFKLVVEK